MNSFLLTWNPKVWPWDNLGECVAALKNHGCLESRWSVGNTKRILPNDRFYLMQLGTPNRGIVGAGFFASLPYYDNHYNGVKDEKSLYCQIEFNQLVLAPDEYLVSQQTLSHKFPDFTWTPQKSGNSIPLDIADKLDELLEKSVASDVPIYEEGARRRVMSSRTERDPRARAACLAHYGFDCVICEFNFGEFYGEAGQGLIHVHHLEPLAVSMGTRQTDPIRDLRPVCANCHAVIHRRQQALSIEKIKNLIRCR